MNAGVSLLTMKIALYPLLVATVASQTLTAAAPAADGIPGFGEKVSTNHLALIREAGDVERAEIDRLRQQAIRLRAEHADILERLESNEREFPKLDVKASRSILEAEIRRKSLIEREQRVGRLLRSIEATITAIETGKSPAAVEARWAVSAKSGTQTQLTSAEALALAERTLAENGRKIVDYWSLTPTVIQQDGRTVWRFRFHMKETNMPMDLSVSVVVDDASRAGTIEPKADDSR